MFNFYRRLCASAACLVVLFSQTLAPTLAQEVSASGEPAQIQPGPASEHNITEGTHILDAATLNSISSLTVSKGATAVIDFGSASHVTLPGDLINKGNLFIGSSNSAVAAAQINAANIVNRHGATISSVLPSEGVGGFTSAVANLDLVLNAVQNILNQGTIRSSGNLTINAGGSIVNEAVVSAARNVNLMSAIGSITNSGLVSSLAGNINVSAITANIAINNVGGTFQALNAINVRDAAFDARANLDINGGSFVAREIDLYSGAGEITANFDNVEGSLATSANHALVRASTPVLTLGAINITGDPTYYNENDGDGGHIVLSGPISVAGPLAILAEGNITATSGLTSIATQNPSGQGHPIYLIAGAQLTGANFPADQTGGVGTTPPVAGNATGNVTVTGPSSAGGNVDLRGADPALIIDAGSTCNDCHGASVKMYAFAGTGGGQVLLPEDSLISTNATDAPGGSQVNAGTVDIRGAAPSGQAIETGRISAVGGTLSSQDNGVIFLHATQFSVNALQPLVFDNQGALVSGQILSGFTGGGDIDVNGEVTSFGIVFVTTLPGSGNSHIDFSADVTSTARGVMVFGSGTNVGDGTIRTLDGARLTGPFTVQVESVKGNVGTSDTDRLRTSSTRLTAKAPGGNVFVDNLGTLTVLDGSASGTFDLRNEADIVLSNALSSTLVSAQNTVLRSVNGSFFFAQASPTTIVGTNSLSVQAKQDITVGGSGPSVLRSLLGTVDLYAEMGSILARTDALALAANAPGGNVTINEFDSISLVDPPGPFTGSSAGGTFDLQAGGNIFVFSGIAATDVLLNAPGRIEIQANVTGTNSVSLTATGDIVNIIPGTHRVRSPAGTITASSSAGSIGLRTEAGSLVANAPTFVPDLSGSIFIFELDDVTLGPVASFAGDKFVITAGGSVTANASVSATNAVTVTAQADITTSGSGILAANTGTVTLTATNGSIGSVSPLLPAFTTAGTLVANAPNGSVSISESDAIILNSVGSSAGDEFLLQAGGNLTASGTVTAGNGLSLISGAGISVTGVVESTSFNVLLMAQSVSNAGEVKALNGQVTVRTVAGVPVALIENLASGQIVAHNITFESDANMNAVNQGSIQATNQLFMRSLTGDVTTSGAGTAFAGLVALLMSGSGKDINVGASLTSDGGIGLQSSDDINVTAVLSANTIGMTANDTITISNQVTGTTSITAFASNGVTTSGAGLLNSPAGTVRVGSTSGNVDVHTNAGSLTVNPPEFDFPGPNVVITETDQVTLLISSAAADFTLTAGGDVTIQESVFAGSDFKLQSGGLVTVNSSVTAFSSITMHADENIVLNTAITTNGAPVKLTANDSILTNSHAITTTRTSGSGAAGNITMIAETGSINAGLVAANSATGNGGHLMLAAGTDITVASLSSMATGSGAAGNINLVAGRNITVQGQTSSSGGNGGGGDVRVAAGWNFTFDCDTLSIIDPSASGGRIQLAGINSSALAADGSGGFVELVASAGTAGGAGAGTVQVTGPIVTSGAGAGSGGSVRVLAGSQTGTAIDVKETQTYDPLSSGFGGEVQLFAEVPIISGGPLVISRATGERLPGGNFSSSGAAGGDVHVSSVSGPTLTGGGPFAVTTNGEIRLDGVTVDTRHTTLPGSGPIQLFTFTDGNISLVNGTQLINEDPTGTSDNIFIQAGLSPFIDGDVLIDSTSSITTDRLTLRAMGDINIAGTLTANNFAGLTASNGGITVSGTFSFNNASLSAGQDITTPGSGLFTGNGLGLESKNGSIGAGAANKLQVAVTFLTSAKAPNGSVFINEADSVSVFNFVALNDIDLSAGGDITISVHESLPFRANHTTITSAGGNVTVNGFTDNGSTPQVVGLTSLTITAEGNITTTGVAQLASTNGTMTLTANSGAIGAIGSPVKTAAANLIANALTVGKDVLINEFDGVNISGPSGAGRNFVLSAAGSVTNTVAGTIDARNISIFTTGGGITANADMTSATVLDLRAPGDIMTVGTASLKSRDLLLTSNSGNIGSATARVNVETTSLAARAFAGSVFVSDVGDLSLDSLSVGGSSAGNILDLQTSGTIRVNDSTTATNSVVLTAPRLIVDDTISATAGAGTILVHSPAGESLTIEGDSAMTAGGGITFTAAVPQLTVNTTPALTLTTPLATFNAINGIVSISAGAMVNASKDVEVNACIFENPNGVQAPAGTVTFNVSPGCDCDAGGPGAVLANLAGNLVITKNLVVNRGGQDLAFLAQGNISAERKVRRIKTTGRRVDGGDITLMAGVEFASVPCDDTIKYIFQGRSKTGGNIALPKVRLLTRARSKGTDGGDVLAVAFSGSTNQGDIALKTIRTRAKSGIAGDITVIGEGDLSFARRITAPGRIQDGAITAVTSTPVPTGPIIIIRGSIVTDATFVPQTPFTTATPLQLTMPCFCSADNQHSSSGQPGPISYGESSDDLVPVSFVQPVSPVSPFNDGFHTASSETATVKHDGLAQFHFDAAGVVSLNSGDILLYASRKTVVNAGATIVSLAKGTIATISRNGDSLKLQSLYEPQAGALRLYAGGKHLMRVAAGEEVIISPDYSAIGLVSKNQSIGRRRVNETRLPSGDHLVSCEFSLPSLLTRSAVLRKIMQSPEKADQELTSKLTKMAACLHVATAGHGPYSSHVP